MVAWGPERGPIVSRETAERDGKMANTRGIPHIGSGRFRRFFRGRRRRTPFSWTNGIFSNTTMPVNQQMAVLELMAHSDFEPAGTTLVTQPLRIHRIQFNGAIACVPVDNINTYKAMGWQWALFVEDKDETDAQLWNSTDNLFPQRQVIRHQIGTKVLAQSQAMLPSFGTFLENAQIPIRFDVKMRKPLRVPFDSALYLMFQWADDYSNFLSEADLFGLSRIVMQLPGSGR